MIEPSKEPRLAELFREVTRLPEPKRQVFLDARCEGDEELRQAVDDLLRLAAASASPLDSPLFPHSESPDLVQRLSDGRNGRFGVEQLVGGVGSTQGTTTREPGTMSSLPSGKRTWHL